jgi:hypothetical protein
MYLKGFQLLKVNRLFSGLIHMNYRANRLKFVLKLGEKPHKYKIIDFVFERGGFFFSIHFPKIELTTEKLGH